MRLWLSGRTDAEIAQTLRLRRPDTIRDWRRVGGWEHLKEIIRHGVEEQVAAMRIDKLRALSERHDQIGAAIEQHALRHLQALTASGDLTATDLRALAGSLVYAQRLRRTALDADNQPLPKEAYQGPPVIIYALADECRKPRALRPPPSASEPASPAPMSA